MAVPLSSKGTFTPTMADRFAMIDDPAGTPLVRLSEAPDIRTLLQENLTKAAISPADNDNGLTISGSSLTGSDATSLIDISQIWNTTGTPTALKLNVTDTASNASSLLMDLQAGGTSRFKVGKLETTVYDSLTIQDSGAQGSATCNVQGGNWQVQGNLSATGDIYFGSGWGRLSASSAGGIRIYQPGSATLGIRLEPTTDVVEQYRSTNAQEFRLYNTYTDGSNNEYGGFKWNSNVLEIGSVANGTGTLRGIMLGLSGNSVGLFGATPVGQQSTTGTTTGFTAGTGTAANDDSTFTGNTGSTAYTVGDIVLALKNIGILAA